MDNSDKIKPLSEKIVASLIKDERKQRLEFPKKINMQKAWEKILAKSKGISNEN